MSELDFNRSHERIAGAWGRVLDTCGIRRREGNRMYINCSQMMISVANIEIQIAMDVRETTGIPDIILEGKLRRRLRDRLMQMLEVVNND